MKIIKTFRIAVMLMACLLLSILLASTPVTAGTYVIPIYSYNGNFFNQFSNTTNPPYTHISGSFEVHNPLQNNLPFTENSYNITNWIFTDGQNTFSGDQGAAILSFAFSTSSTGEIVAPWDIRISMPTQGADYVTLESIHSPIANTDVSLFSSFTAPYNGYARVDDSGGKWSIQYRMIVASSLPEPHSMLLLGLGLVGITGLRKKMK